MTLMSSRTENSARNLIVALAGQGISILLTFLSRTVFLHTLGSTYLGINGLFSNVLTFLNLAELGVGSAITFSLYEPLAENNKYRIASIMRLYKKIYCFIGMIVLALGFLLTPFIRFFITSDTEISYVEVYFALYVINTGISYFFSYKRTLIAADQKQYINTIYQYAAMIVQNIIQIILLFLTHNFVVFLMIQVAATLVQNVAISIKANKMYPYLKNKDIPEIEKSVFVTIKKNTKAMLLHKVGSAVVNSTDNILISKLINIVTVGIYSNYSLVLGALNQLLGQFFTAISASVGNLGAEQDKKALKAAFDKVFFLNFWMYTFCTICCACLFQPFVSLWIGSDMLLGIPVLFVILLNFYMNGMRKCVLTFRESLGLYWYDRYKPAFESVINLGASILLAMKFGILGIFVGTTISCVTTSLWVEPYILCKYGFENKYLNLRTYFIRFLFYTVIGVFDLMICLGAVNMVSVTGIAGFVIKVIIAVLISNAFLVFVFFRNDNFEWLYHTVRHFLEKITRKRGDSDVL